MFQIIYCPNCKKKIKAILKSNRWVKWIEIYCYDCGYRKNIENFDFIQPSSPFFKKIYGDDPIENFKKGEKEKEMEKENLKDKREINLKKLLKPWESDYVKKYTRERKLE